jgi:hypothetical protein
MESGSVLVGDVADEIAADLVLISSEAVHTKQVRARKYGLRDCAYCGARWCR